jgi:hypothetical protein
MVAGSMLNFQLNSVDAPNNSLLMPGQLADLDRIDLPILNVLQQDGRLSNLKRTEAVALSPIAVLARPGSRTCRLTASLPARSCGNCPACAKPAPVL